MRSSNRIVSFKIRSLDGEGFHNHLQKLSPQTKGPEVSLTQAQLADLLKANPSLREHNRHLAESPDAALPSPQAPPARAKDAPRVDASEGGPENDHKPPISGSNHPGSPTQGGRTSPGPKNLVFAPKQPNKTEAEYGRILASEHRGCPVIFEGIRLKWGDTMHYTPDWLVIRPAENYRNWLLIEVKGSHIWSRDAVRFKGCAAQWKAHFDFQMWQKDKGIWSRIL